MDRIKENVAQYIWQSREELGKEGNAQSDWELAERCMCECGWQQIDYDVAFNWLTKYYERNNENGQYFI